MKVGGGKKAEQRKPHWQQKIETSTKSWRNDLSQVEEIRRGTNVGIKVQKVLNRKYNLTETGAARHSRTLLHLLCGFVALILTVSTAYEIKNCNHGNIRHRILHLRDIKCFQQCTYQHCMLLYLLSIGLLFVPKPFYIIGLQRKFALLGVSNQPYTGLRI